MTLDGAALSLSLLGKEVDPRTYLLAFAPELKHRIPPLTAIVGTARPMFARVNHDIWIAACECGARGLPSPGCVVFFETPLGWCARCQNAATGRGWRRVALPCPETRRAVDAILSCRPNVGDRNWEPPETLDDLRRQNVEHGDALPAEGADRVAHAAASEDGWRHLVTPFGPRVITDGTPRYPRTTRE